MSSPAAALPPPGQPELSLQLSTVIALNRTLIRLLEAQFEAGERVTERVQAILDRLQAVSDALGASAEALVALVASETLSPALDRRLAAIEARQDRSAEDLAEIRDVTLTMFDWLAVPYDAGQPS